MQTFLAYPSFTESARVLDNKRLGKQRVEVLQILNALTGKSKGWINHPAVKMWRGCEGALVDYGVECCQEWTKRDFKDTVEQKLIDIWYTNRMNVNILPAWLGNPQFHASHRSNLLRKDKAYYSRFDWSEADNLPYVWPVS
jgi:hypothetical protein